MTIEDLSEQIATKVKAEMEEEWNSIYKPFLHWGGSSMRLKEAWFNIFFEDRYNKAVKEFIDKVEKQSKSV